MYWFGLLYSLWLIGKLRWMNGVRLLLCELWNWGFIVVIGFCCCSVVSVVVRVWIMLVFSMLFWFISIMCFMLIWCVCLYVWLSVVLRLILIGEVIIFMFFLVSVCSWVVIFVVGLLLLNIIMCLIWLCMVVIMCVSRFRLGV